MQFPEITRRQWLKSGLALTPLLTLPTTGFPRPAAYLPDIPRGERPARDPRVRLLHPRDRVPLSFIIDDSTCLVNMGHFCMPQFASAWPRREEYHKPWKSWPREIPDSFVRQFGEWCHENGVKGKYSIVPYPACVGWLDRELPGWSRRELRNSLELVRELMLPDWDIHPEMITHTRVIDLETGRPLEEISSATMENSYPQTPISVDQLASYLEYALKILKNCDLPCEGVTTPGGFASRAQKELGPATRQAVQSVFSVEIPHYFKYVATGDESTEPIVENVRGLDTDHPSLVVNIPAGTGDWYGGWDGDLKSQGHRYSNDDATSGRMVELIERGDPAVMLCHWPGLYSNGSLEGYHDFQEVVRALHSRFADRTRWMKLTEMARYWAARELTATRIEGPDVHLKAPFSCPDFTIEVPLEERTEPVLVHGQERVPLKAVGDRSRLVEGTFLDREDTRVLCFSLPRGSSRLTTR